MKKKIIIIDDEANIRKLLKDFLSVKFDVDTVEDEENLYKMLNSSKKYDLLIADINLSSNVYGFELTKKVKEEFPNMSTVLITAKDVDEYLSKVINYDISNIFIKTVPFNFREFVDYISVILDETALFDIKSYLFSPKAIASCIITKTADGQDAKNRILEMIQDVKIDQKKIWNLKVALAEQFSNAIYHASGHTKEKLEVKNIILKEENYVYVEYGFDDEKVVISINDKGGLLTKNTVVSKILSAMNYENVSEENGRGLFLTRLLIDKVIINIKKKKHTQIVLIQYFDKEQLSNKPIHINQF
jgi:DNA-binding response OmpR family regulator